MIQRVAKLAGVDEAGRGPLAGPVIAAAVILGELRIEGITDSKKLTPLKRVKLAAQIKEKAVCFSFGRAEAAEIDKLNIHHATLLAMQRAILGLSIKPNHILIDGLFVPTVDISCQAIVKGDLLVQEIGAASILAKVARDEEMIMLDEIYPEYGFRQHKGYGTAAHTAALTKFGPCELHRRSFAPVALALQKVSVGG